MSSNNNQKVYSFLYVIDVSGQPYGDTRIGLGTFMMERQSGMLKEFYKEFPDFKRSRNKGSALKSTSHFEKIIKFLDEQGIHMTVYEISGKHWFDYRKKYENESFIKEKIMACGYFSALREKTKPHYKNQVIIDQDSFMDLGKLRDYINKLSKAHKYYFSITVGRAKDNELIRLTDYIAASHKLDSKFLKKLKNHTIIKSKIPELYLKKFFKKK